MTTHAADRAVADPLGCHRRAAGVVRTFDPPHAT